MGNIIICNLPMRKNGNKSSYPLDGYITNALPPKRYYPINAFLEQKRIHLDSAKVILVKKIIDQDISDENQKLFEREFFNIIPLANNPSKIEVIESPFELNRTTYESVLKQLVDMIDVGSKIYCDMTFGPKDLPLIEFAALDFAHKQLQCQIEGIVYGQAIHDADGKIIESSLCDITSLYYMNSVVSGVKCNDPTKAKELLNRMIEL